MTSCMQELQNSKPHQQFFKIVLKTKGILQSFDLLETMMNSAYERFFSTRVLIQRFRDQILCLCYKLSKDC